MSSNNFNLKRFMNGEPVRTRDRQSTATFVAILPEKTPARLVVSTGLGMVNYYMDGSYLGTTYEHDQDLQMAGFLDK